MSKRILMAQIGAAHGIKGEVRVKSFGEDPLALADYKTLFSDSGKSFEIDTSRSAKGQMLVVRFKGIADRTSVEALNGTKLYVERDALPEPEEDEYYQTDLIDCAVIDEAGAAIGSVLAVVNFGAGDLLEIKLPDTTTLLIPFSETYVPKVDIPNRIVNVASLDTFLSDDEDDERDDDPS